MDTTATRPSTTPRLLTACAGCMRQYDVAALAVGSRFHCHCGQVLTVPRFRPHDAAVVRCSACGASRGDQGPSCQHCGADFTFHERDLHTVCPSCMSRVADRSRFCHQCATPILPQGEAGRLTEQRCPACGPQRRLHSRQLGEAGIGVLECPRCAGLWLSTAELDLMAHSARAQLLPKELERPEASAAPCIVPTAGARGPAYRRCPVCRKHMHRRNFGRTSGVIVDTCKDHGNWLDAGELDAALKWIQYSGEAESKERERMEQEHRERQQRIELIRDPKGMGTDEMSEPLPAALLIRAITDYLGPLFRRRD